MKTVIKTFNRLDTDRFYTVTSMWTSGWNSITIHMKKVLHRPINFSGV